MKTTGQILGKAHLLCEWLRKHDGQLWTTYSAAPMAWAVERADKWHVGSAADLPSPKDRETFNLIPFRLPTKLMLIEFDYELLMADGRTIPATGFLLCADDRSDAVVEFLAFGYAEGRFFFDGGGETISEDGCRKLAVYEDFAKDKTSARELQKLSYILEQTLLALHCTNVRSINNEPPAALNKKRKKSGKPPLFTYKTLHIISGERSGPCSHTDDNDEERRSPRLHFRRGHVRHIGDGRITWVQQCMVGNKKRGVVNKAYSIASAPANPLA
jgi:hypothetical protein